MSKWILSNKAHTLFLYSSYIVILLGIFLLFLLSPWLKPVETLPYAKLALKILGGTLGVVGALASLVIWFGMMIFCFREDDSPLRTKIFWFFIFFVMAWFGSAAYFFRVYRRQVQFG